MISQGSEGSPEPLGLTLDGRGANVAVFSAHATAIELCLFDEKGETEIERLRLPCRTGDVFHGHFAGIKAGQRYGLRAQGPYAPAEGHRFNPAKLLVDPYALALDRPFALAPAMFAYRAGAPDGDLSFDSADSAPFVPKAIAIHREATAPSRGCTRRPWAATIVYELQVRGFTKTLAGVPEAIRGTFAGLAHPAAIDHLVKLGVTAVEIMPCAAWLDERHLQSVGLTNYWGYNPVALMAPDPRLAPGGWDEVRACTAALQSAGLEVIVDVVLNHSGEGDELGPTVSLRGLDNASYYRLRRGNPRYYVNDAGCGNILALDRSPVVRLAADALRAWALLGGVDGFQFDLATTIGRRDNGFDPAAPLITAISQDPVLRDLRLIAEPWDIGPGGYQIGAFPTNWGEWNDKFRDTMRKFWRGEGGLIADTVTRFAGSSDIFGSRRRPSRSVNFIVAHDGFTLADLVSHERKHNEGNGERNRDGTDANYSWNNGVEGGTADAAILAARRRDQRNLLATLVLARGTPMLAMGSECGQSQSGNNNAYAQDNALSWLDWDKADPALTAFTAKLIALRKAHPALTRDRFLTGDAVDTTLIPDVEWLAPSGMPMQAADWTSANVRTITAALYAPAEDDRSADRVIVVLHAGREAIELTVPEARAGHSWRRCLDTARENGDGEEGVLEAGSVITVAPRSVIVLEERLGEKSRSAGKAGTSGVAPDILDRLARAAGISPDWYDISGRRYVVPGETKVSLLSDMGLSAKSTGQARESLGRLAEELDRRALPSAIVVREGESIRLRMAFSDGRVPLSVLVRHEDGSEERVRLSPGDLETGTFTALDGRRFDGAVAKLPPQPPGRHCIVLERQPEIACHLTVAPRRCFLPSAFASGKKAFGISAQLYSLRRTGDQGIGDFTTLAELAGIAGRAGFATAGLNPLHALFPTDRGRASPYYPSDRRFVDPIYIDVSGLPAMFGGSRAASALASHANRIAALSAEPMVDYAGVWAVKRGILEASFSDFKEMRARAPDASLAQEFDAFVADGGAALFKFGCFEAISESRQGEAWAKWPAGLAQCDKAALDAFAQENADPVRFQIFLQWLCERQFSHAATRGEDSGLWLGFYRDLAVGAAPEGAEAWANAFQLLQTSSVGAPPDPFSEHGQNWGLQPPDPLAWRRSGYDFFSGMIAANMRHAGALRIDHAMALTRLFVIPNGALARDGAYLSYPVDDLVGQLALESVRARCVVIGEDLGTVPWGFRETMDAADVLSYRVFWFERNGNGFKPPEWYPRKSIACLSTHDLPTLAGWWQGDDIREKEALGLLSAEEAASAIERREDDKVAFLRLIKQEDIEAPADLSASLHPSMVAAAHALIRRTSSLISIAQIDDLVGEIVAVNLPGTNFERPNWRRKLGGTIADLPEKLALDAELEKVD